MLGQKTIEYLIPHRYPFLMVESVIDYDGGEIPALTAERLIRHSEPVFSGVNPPTYWPSVYVLEGLGQCINLLSFIWTCEQQFVSKGYDRENFRGELMNMEGNRNPTSGLFSDFFEKEDQKIFTRIGLLALVDVTFSDRVSAGELLCYKVKQTRVYSNLSHFTVSANVGEQLIAKGTLVGARGGKLEGTV